jgi:putative membrane protein
MSLRTQRSWQALILAALGLFLFSKIWSGTLFWYLNQRFFWLTLAAAVGFMALALATLTSRRDSPGREPDTAEPHDHDHATLPFWGLIVVALPVLLGVLIPTRPLGAAAIANKGVNTDAPLTAGGNPQPVKLDRPSTDRTILDWLRAFNYESTPSVFEGQPADVVGFVYHDPRLAEGQFLVGRFTVTCCVADASAIGMIVDWPQSAALAGNVWVRVKGPVRAATLNEKPAPLITAASVEQVAEPQEPYLYP